MERGKDFELRDIHGSGLYDQSVGAKDEDSKRIKLSEVSRRRIEKLEEANKVIEERVVGLQREVVEPTSIRERIRNFFGRNQKLIREYQEYIEWNNEKIAALKPVRLPSEVHAEDEKYSNPIKIPEKIVDAAEELYFDFEELAEEEYFNKEEKELAPDEVYEDEINATAPRVAVNEDAEDEINVDEIAAKLRQQIEENHLVSEEDKLADEAQLVAEAQQLINEEKEDEKELSEEEIGSIKEEVAKEVNDEEKDYLPPAIPNYIDFNKMPEQEAPVEEKEADNFEDELEHYRTEFISGHITYDEFTAKRKELEGRAAKEEPRSYSPVGSMPEGVGFVQVADESSVLDVKALLEEQARLDSAIKDNNSDLEHLEEEAKSSEEQLESQKQELSALKDELLAAQAAQREEIEAQNATKKEYQDRIARNSEEASELNADIEALRGAMRR
ncbi:MAG: hypothetical protein IJH13_00670 [Bacilli bacterium]|nr:hypothetical protein [Bacilli bacterium]